MPKILPDPSFFGIDGLVLGRLIIGLVLLTILILVGYYNEPLATKILGAIILVMLAYFFFKKNN